MAQTLKEQREQEFFAALDKGDVEQVKNLIMEKDSALAVSATIRIGGQKDSPPLPIYLFERGDKTSNEVLKAVLETGKVDYITCATGIVQKEKKTKTVEKDLWNALFEWAGGPNYQNPRNRDTPLLQYVLGCDASSATLRYLIQEGADPGLRNSKGEAAIDVLQDSPEKLRFLNDIIQARGDINYQNPQTGNTLLHDLLGAWHLDYDEEKIEYILGKGIDPMIKNAKGETALESIWRVRSIPELKLTLVKAMQKKNPEWNGLNYQDPKTGDTVLHELVTHSGTSQAISPYLQLGVDPSIKNHNGQTPLDIGADNNMISSYNALSLSKALQGHMGAGASYRNKLRGDTLLHQAFSRGSDEEEIRALVYECHIDPMIRNSDGQTARDKMEEGSKSEKYAPLWEEVSKTTAYPGPTAGERMLALWDAISTRKLDTFLENADKSDGQIISYEELTSKNENGKTLLDTVTSVGRLDALFEKNNWTDVKEMTKVYADLPDNAKRQIDGLNGRFSFVQAKNAMLAKMMKDRAKTPSANKPSPIMANAMKKRNGR